MGKDHTHFYMVQGRERASRARGHFGQRCGKRPNSVYLSRSVCGGNAEFIWGHVAFWMLERHLLMPQLARLSRTSEERFCHRVRSHPNAVASMGNERSWWAERGRGPMNSEEELSGGRMLLKGQGISQVRLARIWVVDTRKEAGV